MNKILILILILIIKAQQQTQLTSSWQYPQVKPNFVFFIIISFFYTLKTTYLPTPSPVAKDCAPLIITNYQVWRVGWKKTSLLPQKGEK
jgi:hypothetical protein